MNFNLLRYNLFFKYSIFTISLVFLDQLIKLIYCSNLVFIGTKSCLINTGSAFSIFSNITYYPLVIGLLGILGGIMMFYYYKRVISILSFPVASFLLAGVISNSIDRLFIGGVRDMLSIPYMTFFGVFNIADMYLSIVCVCALYVLFFKR